MAACGFKSVQAVHADASEKSAVGLDAPYDRIFVDAPCSGLGTLRSIPRSSGSATRATFERLSGLQRKILDQVARISQAEWRSRVFHLHATTRRTNGSSRAFLAAHESLSYKMPRVIFLTGAKHMVRGKYFQALPQRDNTDGFFAARLRKVS